jgi:hypothetical protein
MGGKCSMDWKNDACIQDFSWNLKGRDYLRELVAGALIILRWILREWGVRG